MLQMSKLIGKVDVENAALHEVRKDENFFIVPATFDGNNLHVLMSEYFLKAAKGDGLTTVVGYLIPSKEHKLLFYACQVSKAPADAEESGVLDIVGSMTYVRSSVLQRRGVDATTYVNVYISSKTPHGRVYQCFSATDKLGRELLAREIPSKIHCLCKLHTTRKGRVNLIITDVI